MAWSPVTLEGRHVRLEPLRAEHLDALCRVGLDAELWQWNVRPVRDRADMQAYLDAALQMQADDAALPFVTIEQAGGQVIGSTRFANISVAHRRAEIGWTWIARLWQRTAVNTEAKYLMLCHAFEAHGCARVEFKTDVLNVRSRNAILRLGAQEEGTLRHHMLAHDGRRRDTIYFSILDHEWPQVKAHLEAKLQR